MVIVRYVGRDTSDERKIRNKGLDGRRGRSEIGNGEKKQGCCVWKEGSQKGSGLFGGSVYIYVVIAENALHTLKNSMSQARCLGMHQALQRGTVSTHTS